MKDKLSSGLDNLGNTFTKGISDIIDFIKDIPQHLINLKDRIISGFKDVVDTVVSIPNKIVELFKELLKFLFIPNKTPIDDIKEKFDTKFPIINQISTLLNGLFDNYKDTDSPLTFIINYKGQDHTIINLEWYRPYKGNVNMLIICISWLYFLFWLVRFIPKMLGGIN